MRAVVTGSAGFVGRHLVAALTADGDDVVGLDRASGDPDLTDRTAMFDAIAAADADVVFHLGGQSHVPTSWEDPIGTLRSNVEGTQNVLDASYAAAVARVIVVTSAEVYGRVGADELPIGEAQPLRPVTPYAASKAAADMVALQAHAGRGQDVLRARAFNHLGPGQRSSFVAAGLARRIAEAERTGRREISVGTLTSRRDFTDVRDVVQAYLRLAADGQPGMAYNVCSGVDRAIADIADGLLAHASVDVTLVPDPDLERAAEVEVVRGDPTRIREHTGWTPQIPFETSLADVLDDARARGNNSALPAEIRGSDST